MTFVVVRSEAFNSMAQSLAQLRADLKEQRDYNRALVQQIVEMRREGFAPKPQPPTPLLSSPVDDAILARANGNSRLRTHLMRQRDKLRKEGLEDDAIVSRLSIFRDPDPDE
jgi:hypothetical protein